MKIALCISGQPRFIEEAFPYIKKNIIDCNDQVDVFLHCWFSAEEVGKRFSHTSDTTREQGNGIIKEDTIKLLQALYKPISLQAEPQVDFSDKVKPEYTAARDKTNPFATFSMWESIARCNALKKHHEEARGFTYDTVIKARFDLKLESPLIINDFDKTCLYTSGHNPNPKLVEDIIFYASSEVMDNVVDLPHLLDNHFHTINIWNNEQLLHTHCAFKAIPIKKEKDWKFTLARGNRTFKDSLWYYKNRILSKLGI